jgi:murein L,D-transpeptidase YcbB/YkuD
MLRGWLLSMFVGFAGPQPMRIVVNIPAFRLDVYVKDSLIRTMRIAPGMFSYRTPRASFAITSVQWNPWWIPPNSPWAAKEKPTPPGSGNPMGRVKLNFQPLYFLHGTPLVHSIGTAASHGCIRMKNDDAIELARLTLRFGMRALTPHDIDALAADTASTRTIQLEDPVPIEIRYDLVEVRNGRLSVYRDVYGLASKSLRAEVYAALVASGLDTMTIDSNRVRALVRRVQPAGNSIDLDSIRRRSP